MSEITDSQNGSVLLSPRQLLFFYLSLLLSRMRTMMLCLDVTRFNDAVHQLLTDRSSSLVRAHNHQGLFSGGVC